MSAQIIPTIGRIVIYKLAAADITRIQAKRLGFAYNEAREGDEYPAMIVRTWGGTPASAVNLKVMLDGEDSYWATSRTVGEKPGDYHWMDYQKGQAAKAEALERQIAEAKAA